MRAQREQYSVARMAKIFGVSRSGYYGWMRRGVSQHERADAELLGMIGAIYKEHHGR
jgi:transposase-like protein